MMKRMQSASGRRNVQYMLLSILAAYLYVFMEWIFFVTKPSFMDYMNIPEKFAVLFGAGLTLSTLVVLLLLFFLIANRIFAKTRFHSVEFGVLPAAFLTACLALIMVDNFTYTIFEFGIATVSRSAYPIYLALYFVFLFYYYRLFARYISNSSLVGRFYNIFCGVILLTSIFFVIPDALREKMYADSVTVDDAAHEIPNIIIMGTDGLDADHMSLYGYERETTPFITLLAQDSLVAENHFSNGCCTAGSTASTLTGKLPIETRVLYNPDALQGADAYQHLPYILKNLDYHTIQIGDGRHVNSFEWNMQMGFDFVYGKSYSITPILAVEKFSRPFGSHARFFMVQMAERLLYRLYRIFYVENQDWREGGNSLRMEKALEVIEAQDGPYFIHMHLLDSHGPKFHPEDRVFSAGQKQKKPWMRDFYDDSILSYDRDVERIVTALKENGQYENTILILYTDHGMKWSVESRIPLVVHFPNNDHAGVIDSNTQNLDIAPTILDYMGIEIPGWMAGDSLLQPVAKDRMIFGFTVSLERKPPFFQFGGVQVIQCQKKYFLNLFDGLMRASAIGGHTSPCGPAPLKSESDMRFEILTLLKLNGYDPSKLDGQK